MSRSRRPPGESRLLQSVYYAWLVGSRLVGWIPERTAYRLADSMGRLAARFSKKRGAVAKNLARITGDAPDSKRVEQLIVEVYKSYVRYWLETFRLVRKDRSFFLERFNYIEAEIFHKVASRGKGVIAVVGHLGNWDAAGAWAGASGHDVVTVAEVLRPRRMFDFFARHRARLGMTIHPAQAGATQRLIDAVEAGAVVAIVGDRDLKGRGPVVEFFGEPAPFPAGPARVALATGVPLFVAGIYSVVDEHGRRGWEAHTSPLIEVPDEPGPDAVHELTQEVARHLEGFVARRPEEWHVLQPFWPADRAAGA